MAGLKWPPEVAAHVTIANVIPTALIRILVSEWENQLKDGLKGFSKGVMDDSVVQLLA